MRLEDFRHIWCVAFEFQRHPGEVPAPSAVSARNYCGAEQRLLQQEKKDMRQIVMITDGKPSCLTLEDGRMYKNAFGLDPLVISRTLEEVNRCKKQGILINTFMLETSPWLSSFVDRMTTINKGRAFYSSPDHLGEYILVDYVRNKRKKIS